jgi:hypothetical protein
MLGEKGWGYFKDISTGWPQMPHILSEAKIFFLFLSNARRCVPSWSGRFLLLGFFSSAVMLILLVGAWIHQGETDLAAMSRGI